MKNNFNFNASIKMKDLEKMENLIDLFYREKIDNEDLSICVEFRNLLDKFDGMKFVKMYDLIDSFAVFYEKVLLPYCKGKILCEKFNEFDFEQVQFVMDKMKEIIGILCASYGM